MRAILRQVRISPRKARVIAKIIKGKKVEDALSMLKIMPKKGAKILYKVIDSAAHNAKNNFGQDVKTLYISSLQIDGGTQLKRSLPRSRGRVHPIKKKCSNIKVEVAVLAAK